MSELLPLVWHNGAVVPVAQAGPSIGSISLHMGTGVFDGLMAYWTGTEHRLFRPQDHFARFIDSAGKMGMPLPWSVVDLTAAALALAGQAPGRHCYVRPLAYRGGPELWLTGADKRPVDLSIFLVPTQRLLDRPITIHFSTVERISSAAMPISWKVCGLYVNSYLARRAAEREGFDDAILLDRNGHVSEASAANIFVIQGTRLLTPALSGDVFPGITRRTVMEICRELDISCVQTDIKPDTLRTATGAFLCSTLMELRPVARLEEKELATASLPIYRAISTSFARNTVPSKGESDRTAKGASR
jgi:branched-chain amino acid aminotransferase